MILTEFDEEKYLQMVKEDSFYEGRVEGIKSTLINILSSKFSTLPKEISNMLQDKDEKTLSKYILLAATASNLDEFLEAIK